MQKAQQVPHQVFFQAGRYTVVPAKYQADQFRVMSDAGTVMGFFRDFASAQVFAVRMAARPAGQVA